MDSEYYFECATCGEEFPKGIEARDYHCEITGHSEPDWECFMCPQWFLTSSSRNQHMDDANHWPHECSRCAFTFPSERAVTDHEANYHLYCYECNRHFDHPRNVDAHFRSAFHHAGTVSCPFCDRNFATASGVVQHLESSACPRARGLNRDTMYEMIRSRDPDSHITKKLLGWHGSTTYVATGRTWNGKRYTCDFCTRTFRGLQDLSQHLGSLRHQKALYHCPNRACKQEFRSLGSTIDHLESQSCDFMSFNSVQNSIHDLVSGNRRIVFV